MIGNCAAATILVSMAVASPSLIAMNRAAGSSHCRVIAGEKLLAEQNGPASICTEIERAIAAGAPRVRYSVEVKVLSKSRLAASVVVNGRALPEQNFAIMDSDLNAGAIQRFAASLARIVAEEAKAQR